MELCFALRPQIYKTFTSNLSQRWVHLTTSSPKHYSRFLIVKSFFLFKQLNLIIRSNKQIFRKAYLNSTLRFAIKGCNICPANAGNHTGAKRLIWYCSHSSPSGKRPTTSMLHEESVIDLWMISIRFTLKHH